MIFKNIIITNIVSILFFYSSSVFSFTLNNEIDLDDIAIQSQNNHSSVIKQRHIKEENSKLKILFENNNKYQNDQEKNVYIESSKYSHGYSSSKNNNNAKIAVFLPLSGSLSQVGREIKEGVHDYFFSNPNTFLYEENVLFYDVYDKSSLGAAFDKAMQNNIDFILGPLQKDLINSLARMNKSIPVLAFNKTSYNDKLINPLFYQSSFFVENKVNSVYRKLVEMNKQDVIIAYPNNNSKWSHLAKQLKIKLLNTNINVEIISSYNPDYNQLKSSIKSLLGSKISRIEEKRNEISELRAQGIDPITRGYSLKGDVDAIVFLANKRDFGTVAAVFNYYYASDIDKFAIINDGFGLPQGQTIDVLSNHLYVCENRSGLAKAKKTKNKASEYEQVLSKNFIKNGKLNTNEKNKNKGVKRTPASLSNRIFYLLGYNMALISDKMGHTKISEGSNFPLKDGSNIILSFPNIFEYQVPCFKPINDAVSQ